MKDRVGACVFVDCISGDMISPNPTEAAGRLTPCSTFKIWNTLIGVECGIISAPEEPFYKWDGETRFIPDWNRDLTLKEAFRVSCVPAFQNLAVKIGKDNMQRWLDTIVYGDRDISSGIDIFWLPRDGKKSIRISPEEQARLIQKLVTGKLPFSEAAVKVLKEIMLITKTSKGTFYGKTGSGTDTSGGPVQNIGWFAGWVESDSKAYAFACVVKGENLTGKDARSSVEKILAASGLL